MFHTVLLILASQRIETVFKNWVGRLPGYFEKWISDDVTTKRGAPPTMIEWLILAWVCGMVYVSLIFTFTHSYVKEFLETFVIYLVRVSNSSRVVIEQFRFQTNLYSGVSSL